MRPGTRVRITSPTALHGRTGRVVTTEPTPTELAVYVMLDGERIPLRFGASVVEVIELVKGALASDDPARYIQRRAAADASEAAADAAIEQALGK